MAIFKLVIYVLWIVIYIKKKKKKTIYALWGVADSAALWGYEIALFLSIEVASEFLHL